MTDYELAQEIARRAHAGQVDQGGNPYIEHPETVAASVTGETQKVVAILHDVVEDTAVNLETLKVLFGSEVANALRKLTHADGVAYLDYIRAMEDNPIAREVKLADLRHNSDISRLPNPTARDYARLEKYREAMRILESFDKPVDAR